MNDNIRMPVNGAFEMSLRSIANGRAPYSIQDLQQAMSETTALTNLRIELPANRNVHVVRGLIQFLVQYVSSRTHLQKLVLRGTYGSDHAFIVQQFVMAAAQSQSIHALCLIGIRPYSVAALVEFFNANRTVKILEMRGVSFTVLSNTIDHLVDLTSPSVELDKLALEGVDFYPSQSRSFAEILVPRLKPAALELGRVSFWPRDAEAELMPRVVSALMQSPVTRLTVHRGFEVDAFRTALTAGMATVEVLSVDLDFFFLEEKFTALANTLPENMEALSVIFVDDGPRTEARQLPAKAKKKFFRMLDACVTLTAIQVLLPPRDNFFGVFTRQEMLLLQDGRTRRNSQLQRFMANPEQLSEKELLVLILQMENSLTGLYKIVGKIPDRIRRNPA